jgi:hypothetical protein
VNIDSWYFILNKKSLELKKALREEKQIERDLEHWENAHLGNVNSKKYLKKKYSDFSDMNKLEEHLGAKM